MAPPRFLLLAAALLATLALGPTAARAATYYARGGGSGSTCAQGDECSLAKAISKAGDGDAVVLVSGPDFTPGKLLAVDGAVDIGGVPGQPRPTIVAASEAAGLAVYGGAHVHDVNVTSSGVGREALALASGASAERVSATASAGTGCVLFSGHTTLSDSVCLSGTARGLLLAGSIFFSNTAELRNVTVVGGSEAISAEGAAVGLETRIEASNTIAVGGPGSADIHATGSGEGTASVVLTHSDYDSVDPEGPRALITAVGTSGNLVAPPLFVNQAAADLHQSASSPTVDAGLTEPANGSLDLDANPRALSAHPSCDSTAGPTDIGAYEYVAPVPPCVPGSSGSPVGATSAPPSPSPPPPAPGTRLKKAKIDREKRTATFVFAGTGAVDGFLCKLQRPTPSGGGKAERRPARFTACRSPRTYRHLVPGRYAFTVAARGAGGTDPTPVRRRFELG